MPARSNAFQAVVYFVERHLAASSVEVTESAFLTDRITGEKREVDVLITCEVAGRPVVIGVECRDRSRADDVTWVEAMRARYDDLPVDRLVLVSSSGFSAPATIKAAHYNIETLTPDESIPDDGPLAGLKDYSVEIRDLTYQDVTSLRGAIEVDGQRRNLNLVPHHVLYDADGRELGHVGELVQSAIDKADMRTGVASAPAGTQQVTFEIDNPLCKTDGPESVRPHLRSGGDSPQLLPLLAVLVVCTVHLDIRPVELVAGTLRSAGYLYGSGQVGGHDALLVFTQIGDDPQLAVRLTRAEGGTIDLAADRSSQTLLPHTDAQGVLKHGQAALNGEPPRNDEGPVA